MDTTHLFNYPDLLKRFCQRSGESESLVNVMDQLAAEDNFLKTAKICLSFGTGIGGTDIEFIKRCLPNLKRLIVVEKDSNCVNELKVNLQNTFGVKLQVEIHEMSIKNFMKNEDNWKLVKDVDVITCFHSLYYLTYSDRVTFFKLCFDSWLKLQTGVLILTNDSKQDVLVKINEELKQYVKPLLYSEQIKDELKMLNLNIVEDIQYAFLMDFKECGRDLHEMLEFTHKVPISLKMYEEAARIVVPDGVGRCCCNFVMVGSQPTMS